MAAIRIFPWQLLPVRCCWLKWFLSLSLLFLRCKLLFFLQLWPERHDWQYSYSSPSSAAAAILWKCASVQLLCWRGRKKTLLTTTQLLLLLLFYFFFFFWFLSCIGGSSSSSRSSCRTTGTAAALRLPRPGLLYVFSLSLWNTHTYTLRRRRRRRRRRRKALVGFSSEVRVLQETKKIERERDRIEKKGKFSSEGRITKRIHSRIRTAFWQ